MDCILKCFIVLLLCGVFGDPDEVKSVFEGDPVTLQTGAKIQSGDKILWRFGKEGSANLLVQMHGNKILYKDSIDVRLRDRLLISNTQTGDLTINNMRIKYSGLYTAEIQTGSGSSFKKFRVTVNESSRVLDVGPSNVKSVSVNESKSVTLHTDVQTQKGDLILWRFGDKSVLIAKGDMEDNKISVYDDDDGRFRDRLKMNNQTGDLTITNIRTSNAGVYNLKIISSRETKYKTFSVSVRVIGAGFSTGAVAGLCVFFLVVIAVIAGSVILYLRMKQTVIMMSVYEGDTLTLHGADSRLQPETDIEWKFKGRVILTGRMTEDMGLHISNIDAQQVGGTLDWNPIVGHLIISNILKKDTGLYEVKITNDKGTSHRKTQVNVIDKMFSVSEGDRVILPCANSKLQTGAQIEWKFNNRVIIKGVKTEDKEISVTQSDDQQFKDRLKLDDKGQLIISNILKKDTGPYEVNITNDKGTSHRKTQVNVIAEYVTVFEGGNAHLHGADSVLQTGTQIEWKFNNREIIRGMKTEDRVICVTYSDDQQFKDRLELGDDLGYLIINKVSKEDSGVYEVNITYNKETTHNKIPVNVIDGSTGEDFNRQMGVFAGDPVALRGATSKLQKGAQIEWKFKGRVITTGEKTNDREIRVTHSDDQQFKDRLELDRSVGYLIINDISYKDSGVYEAKITNNKETSYNKTHVIVIDGSPKEDLNRQKGEPVKTVYGVVNVVEKDSARTYRNDPGVDIPLLKKV